MQKSNWISLIFYILFHSVVLHHNCYAQSQEETLKLAIIPHRSNLGNEHAYGVFIQLLEKETRINFQWIGSKTYSDVIEKLKTRQADIGYLGPFAYVEAQDNFGVRLICRTMSKNSIEFYHSIIITRKDSGSNTLEDLKGKSFAFTDPKSTSGFLFPMAGLMKAGIQLEDFSQTQYLKRHVNSLLAVYNGHSHAGATSYTAIDKININYNEIKILWESDAIYRGPWVAQKDMPDKQFFKIQKAMLKMTQHKDAEKIFNGLTTKGFVRGLDSDYNNVRDVAKRMKLKSKQDS
ncbi:phosphate/phosphite/phosphonate ABC transporter substrate-binding protein [Desulfobacula phenolica]|uniref:Phosphonate transport system substrate-binding protein n=1 Tax=Desulfobacula phenolica TaxID=90732 RepID=A0A1H2DLX3_9BACT|nr:phosphate/phosphite/phosphonate ABC transporter substrate-binding protein [Desulfobacula phenolica]SDT83910.1 phosphonate transport system substrate-binding protein [Desulfobacula phenolica]